MTLEEKFQEIANVEFVESNGDIEIGTLNTADGYEIYYITTELRELDWENDVFYYQPDFDIIIQYIEDIQEKANQNRLLVKDTNTTIACWDIDEYFDEYYMLDYLESKMDADEFEKFKKLI
jgi:hypothetical protein|tara:strand:+ start:134 stop:496 length:363 start_codon:yes stop_codon:yes gene_type:complete